MLIPASGARVSKRWGSAPGQRQLSTLPIFGYTYFSTDKNMSPRFLLVIGPFDTLIDRRTFRSSE